jgi:hypothetical protein
MRTFPDLCVVLDIFMNRTGPRSLDAYRSERVAGVARGGWFGSAQWKFERSGTIVDGGFAREAGRLIVEGMNGSAMAEI